MEAPIAIAILALIGSIASTVVTAYFARGRQRAAVTLDRYAALQTNFETLDGLIRTLRRELREESESRQALEASLDVEKLARRKAQSRIEQLSERLDQADKLVRSLEIDLEQERKARLVAEEKIEEMSTSIAALTEENVALQARLSKGLSN